MLKGYSAPFKEAAIVACGPPPIVIDPTYDVVQLRQQLQQAKDQGAIALVVQIMCTRPLGHLVPTNTLKEMCRLCSEIGLPIAIDETITSFRCGAPFLYQRTEYSPWLQPDLVIFGKALRLSGIGVNFEGPFFSRLQFTQDLQKLDVVYKWFELMTRAIPVSTLVEALFVLDAARQDDWPRRSLTLAAALKSALQRAKVQDDISESDRDRDSITGLGAIMFVPRSDVDHLSLDGTPIDGHLRLTPTLDGMADVETFLKELFEKEADGRRRAELSLALQSSASEPLWCHLCGEAREPHILSGAWCTVCCLGVCGETKCMDVFKAHACL